MSVSHHGGESDRDELQNELMKRFIDQAEGKAKRVYEKGRISAEDDGMLAIAVAADTDHKRVILSFGKHVEWVGFDVEDAVALAKMIIDKAKLISDVPISITI